MGVTQSRKARKVLPSLPEIIVARRGAETLSYCQSVLIVSLRALLLCALRVKHSSLRVSACNKKSSVKHPSLRVYPK